MSFYQKSQPPIDELFPTGISLKMHSDLFLGKIALFSPTKDGKDSVLVVTVHLPESH